MEVGRDSLHRQRRLLRRRPDALSAELATALAGELGLDGSGRLLDLGCGPGSLTVLLAPLFAEAVGVDPDAGMLAEAAKRDDRISWRRSTAERIPLDWGPFRLVTFAQSFHWMDQVPVAKRLRLMLESGGACVHVSATTHRGVDGTDPLPYPRPPHDAIEGLVVEFLGPVRRAGAGRLPNGTPGGEGDSFRAAGFTHERRLDLQPGHDAYGGRGRGGRFLTVLRHPAPARSACRGIRTKTPVAAA